MRGKIWIQLLMMTCAVGFAPRAAHPQDLRRPITMGAPLRETAVTPTREAATTLTRETRTDPVSVNPVPTPRPTADAPISARIQNAELFTLEGVTLFDGNQRVGTEVTAPLGDFTVEVWFKDDKDNKEYERLADKSFQRCLWLGRNATTPNSWGGGVQEGSGPFGIFVPLQDGEWHQLVSVRQGGMHYIYGDGGAVIASGAVSAAACDATPLAIGAWGDPAATQQRFTGEISAVAVFNYALTLEEIKTRFDRRNAVRPTAPAGTAEETPVRGSLTQENPVRDSSVRDSLAQELPVRDSSTPDNFVRDTLMLDNPVRDNQVPENPVRDGSTPENPVRDSSAQDAPVRDSPTPDNLVRDGSTPNNTVPASPTRDNPTRDNLSQNNTAPVIPTRDGPVPANSTRNNTAPINPVRDSLVSVNPVPTPRPTPDTLTPATPSRAETGNTITQGGVPSDSTRSPGPQRGAGEGEDASAIANLICPPNRCYEEKGELVFKNLLGTEHRYPNMTRGKFIELQLQRIAEMKALEKARAGGVESLRTYLLQTAPLIVRGTPTTQTVESPKDTIRRTVHSVTVGEVLRGKFEQPTLTMFVPGGCITKDDCETVLGLRTPQVNQEFIFLLYPLANNKWGLVDVSESVYRVENGRLPDWNLDLTVVRERAKVAAPVALPAAVPATAPAATARATDSTRTPAATATPIAVPASPATPVIPTPVMTPTRASEPAVAPAAPSVPAPAATPVPTLEPTRPLTGGER